MVSGRPSPCAAFISCSGAPALPPPLAHLPLHPLHAIPSLLPTVRRRPSNSGRPNRRARIHDAAPALPPTGAASPPQPSSRPEQRRRPLNPPDRAVLPPLPFPPIGATPRPPSSPRPEQCLCNQELAINNWLVLQLVTELRKVWNWIKNPLFLIIDEPEDAPLLEENKG
ncbi:hypothetical protein GQ55_8G125100 [Panicum hallii var. hallii]|uniref:Uncharacterized protein n=1 Tax=Panicum hallii var. hallii TaxID=1504633 RepID=A0A2T7CMW5_9POAL|nr:hypothetical protein GQ55_8G125100 [Panicum hallii var. hallii]